MSYRAFWLILITYLTSAAMSRFTDLVQFDDGSPTAFDGANILVTFMIVFYVGYCYTRWSEQYFIMTSAVRSIITCCGFARACLPADAPELVAYWQLLNMMHGCCYIGFSTTYSSHNMLLSFAEEFKLFASDLEKKRCCVRSSCSQRPVHSIPSQHPVHSSRL
jgi:hypothetical protein